MNHFPIGRAFFLLAAGIAFTTSNQSKAADLPLVTTMSATKVSYNESTLNSSVNPQGFDTAMWFEWGLPDSVTNITTSSNVGNGTNAVVKTSIVSGLAEATLYNFRAAATNEAGTNYGSLLSFTTAYSTNGPGGAVCLDGIDDFVSFGAGGVTLSNIQNTFTLEMWVNPGAARTQTVQTNNGNSGTNGQRLVIFPDDGIAVYGSPHASAGISVGTNGIAVYERAGASYFPSVISYTNAFTNWIHVALVYNSRTPTLYVNGAFAKSGSSSIMSVHPSLNLGGGGLGYGNFEGCVDEIRLWSTARTGPDIFNNRYLGTPNSTSGLVGLWRFSETGGETVSNQMALSLNGVFSNGVTRNISTAPFRPEVVTLAASNITDSSADLNALVDPNNASTAVSFYFGVTPSPSGLTGSTNIGNGNSPIPATIALSNLLAGTRYYFQANALSVANSTGSILQFITDPLPPETITSNAASIAPTSVTIRGSARANGLQTTAWFQWGTTSSNLVNIAGETQIGADNSYIPVTTVLTNLAPGTTYFYRIFATNALGGTNGNMFPVSTPLFTLADTISPMDRGGVAAADFTGDGKFDLATSGIDSGNTPRTYLYTNAAGAFGSPLVLTGSGSSSLAWADYDRDGRPDLVVAGRTNLTGGTRPSTQIYRNTGAGFTAGPTLASNFFVLNSAVAWGDLDNDGRPDLLIAGDNTSNKVAAVLRNTPTGFTNATGSLLPGLQYAAVAWADYDNDGWQDFIISGSDGTNPVTQLWHNGPNGPTNSLVPLTPLDFSAVAWGDYDNDGWVDLLISGRPASLTNIVEIWRNTGTGFTNVSFNAKGVASGQVAWVDFDNDGLLDIWLTGSVANDLWRNTGTNFTAVSSTYFASKKVNFAAGSWADMDDDGRLDLSYIGTDGGGTRVGEVWKNHTVNSNMPPTVPTGLNAALLGTNGVLLTWEAASDAQTPPTGLVYNIRVGTTPGDDNIVPSHSRPDGSRIIAFSSDLPHRRFAIVTNLNPALGPYYWGVQAVDTSQAGGPWASAVLLGAPDVETLPASGISSNAATLNALVNPGNQASTAWFEYGLTTAYGSTTPVTNLVGAGSNVVISASIDGLMLGSNYHYRAVAANASGVVAGDDIIFVPSQAPGAWTLFATNFLTNFNATITGSVNPGGIPTVIFFEWGLTTAYGNFTSPIEIGNGTESISINTLLSGLALNGIYHYRLVASNAVAVTYGPDQTFGVNLKPGDLNFDGTVDLNELNTIIQYYRGLLP